jgi:prolycopene isomerase
MILSTPPSRLPLQGFAQFVFSQLVDGAFYCVGGAEKVIEAVLAAFQRHGGEIVVNARVTRVVVEGGRAAGVVIGESGLVRAPVVVSNAAAMQTYEQLVGPGHLEEAFLRKLRRLTPSVSGFVLFGGTRLDLGAFGAGHQNLVSGWDLEGSIVGGIAGQADGAFAFYVPTTVDRSLAPANEHVFTAICPRPYDLAGGWDAERPRFAELLLDKLEARFPGFREGLVFRESATPRALERFTLNTGGAIYGWENTLAHQGGRRPAQRTPIPGLYLAGHWTRPGTGSLRASVSGVHAAQLVLKDAGDEQGAAAFRYARLPPAE